MGKRKPRRQSKTVQSRSRLCGQWSAIEDGSRPRPTSATFQEPATSPGQEDFSVPVNSSTPEVVVEFDVVTENSDIDDEGLQSPDSNTEPQPAEKSMRIRELYSSTETPSPRPTGIVSTESSEYIFTTIDALAQLVKCALCPMCKIRTLDVSASTPVGFAHTLLLTCKDCGEVSKSSTSNRIASDGESTRPPFDVNRRAVKAINHMGKGYAGMEHFCSVMNMRPLCESSFNDHLKAFESSATLEETRIEVRKAYQTLNPLLDDKEVFDMTVSFDGTWHKRGFTSNFGVAAVVDLLTGYVVDYTVLSKYCQACEIAKKKYGGEKTEAFTKWKNGHASSCLKNYHGSSPAMEVAAADVLWRPPLELSTLCWCH